MRKQQMSMVIITDRKWQMIMVIITDKKTTNEYGNYNWWENNKWVL